MNKRIESNLKLLEHLTELLSKHPELRFIQALSILGIIDEDKNGNIIDRFYEEPSETLKRIYEKL